MTLPFKVIGVVRELVENLGEISAVDLATGLAAALPKGIYSSSGIERYVHEVSPTPTARTTSGCSSASSTWSRPTSTRPSG